MTCRAASPPSILVMTYGLPIAGSFDRINRRTCATGLGAVGARSRGMPLKGDAMGQIVGKISRKIVTVVAVTVVMGWGAALAQDQSAKPQAPQADQQSPDAANPPAKRTSAV